MKKIAICTNHYYPLVGGAEKVVQSISEYLSREYEVYVFTRKVPLRDSRDFKSYHVIEYIQGDYRSFEQKLKLMDFHSVIVYSDMFDYFRQISTQKWRFNVILAVCGANFLFQNKNLVNLLYRNFDSIKKVVCHSSYDRDYKLFSGDRFRSKTVIIPNGVHLDEFDSCGARRKDVFPEGDDKIWILNVSNFFPGKGQEFIIDILKSLKNPEKYIYIQAYSDSTFDVGKQLEHKWKMRCKDLNNIGIEVKIFKNVPRKTIVSLFKTSNLFLFTSQKEVAPLCLIESMSAKLPWVSMNVGNAEELKGGFCIVGPKNHMGYNVVNSYIIQSYVNKIDQLINLPTMGEDGYYQVIERFNWDKILPSYVSIIEN